MSIDQFSDDDIIAEVRRLQYLYRLKREIRYGRSRHDAHDTESVAEHVYGMLLLAHYFLEFEDLLHQWDQLKIFTMITIHDLDEIETGDTIGYLKTDAQYQAELSARHVVAHQSPTLLRTIINRASAEYEARQSPEALFTRAIDKLEPLIHLYNEAGRKLLLQNKTTIEQSRSIKDEHVRYFPSIRRFTDVLHVRMVAEGYFYIPRGTVST